MDVLFHFHRLRMEITAASIGPEDIQEKPILWIAWMSALRHTMSATLERLRGAVLQVKVSAIRF